MFSEKATDFELQTQFVKSFGEQYNTKTNTSMFGSLSPDGWYLLSSSVLLIIENKFSISKHAEAEQQVIKYAKTAYARCENIQLIICINGFGTNESFSYSIYEFTRFNTFKPSKLKTFDELKRLYPSNQSVTTEAQTSINLQSLHNLIVKETGITSTKDLSLFTAFCILATNLPSIRQLLHETSQQSILFSSLMTEFQNFYDNDEIILSLFNQPKLKTVNLKPILNIVSQLPKTSINDLFKQFCKYTKEKQDKNIELTPDYIARIMSYYANSYYGYNSITDPFAGSSSLLLKTEPKSTKIAIEKEAYMYLISKLNLEINNIHNYTLIHSDMSNVNFKADIAITNPPYTKKLSGKDAIAWLCELINKVDVIIAIIPTSNLYKASFNKYKQQLLDNKYFLRSVINCGKCFKDVNTEASIIVLDRLEPKSPYHVFDLTFKNKVDYIKPPLNDIIILPAGENKIQNIIDDIDYIEITDYDHTSAWNEAETLSVTDSLLTDKYYQELTHQIRLFLDNDDNVDTKRFGAVFDAISSTMKSDIVFQPKTYIDVEIGRFFEPVKKTHNYNYKTVNLPATANGNVNVPMFACKKLDNGIAGYVEHFEYNGNVIVVVKSRNATCGYAFHYNGKLSWSNFNLVIRPKFDLSDSCLDSIASLMTDQLAPHHTDKEAFNMSQLLIKKLSIPSDHEILKHVE